MSDGGSASAGVALAILLVVVLIIAAGFVHTWRQARRRRRAATAPAPAPAPPPAARSVPFAIEPGARAVAVERSAADTRFAPPVLEVAVRHAARGRSAPGGGEIEGLRVVALDAAAEPARLLVEVGVRWPGTPERRTERWTLTLDGPPERPWRAG